MLRSLKVCSPQTIDLFHFFAIHAVVSLFHLTDTATTMTRFPWIISLHFQNRISLVPILCGLNNWA